MILFCLDTSGPVAGAALMENGVVRYEAMAVNAFTHSQSILPITEEAYAHTGLKIEDTDYFAVTVGPGSFTGVRIGVSTVKALAHAEGKPCIAVDALEAMAAGVQPFPGVICPIQDARAGQVYGAAFQGGTLERLLPDEPIKLEAYLEKASAFGQKMLFLGDGMPVHRAEIEKILGDRAEFAPPHLAFLRPASVAYLAWNKRNEAVDYQKLSPLYLRPPQAERQKNLRELAMSDVLIRRMTLEDVDGVHAIEQATFKKPWKREDFVKEMTTNTCARYLVAEDEGKIVGFAGAWIVLDEAHITNIAVLEDHRGRGIGRALTEGLLQYAANLGVVYATLEVRRSNEIAQSLYKSLGFEYVGLRKRYYEDNGEDAFLYCCQHMPEADPDFEEAETVTE